MKRKFTINPVFASESTGPVTLIAVYRTMDYLDWEVEQIKVSGKNLIHALYNLLEAMLPSHAASLYENCAEVMAQREPDKSEDTCWEIVENWSDAQCAKYLGSQWLLEYMYGDLLDTFELYSIMNAKTGEYLIGGPVDEEDEDLYAAGYDEWE